MNKTIGKCSLCGGSVQVPAIWSGIYPPTPTCSRCGATKAVESGPIIKMEPRRPRTVLSNKLTEFLESEGWVP